MWRLVATIWGYRLRQQHCGRGNGVDEQRDVKKAALIPYDRNSKTMRWDLVGSSLGDSPKESKAHWECEGRSPERRPEDLPQDCRRLPEYIGVRS
ncbi:hypothetical protein B296_00041445 [Ensete ventricosum]|uniref:Uncharacterized protein n=1 Tax=Ensete ventricosum TaxID=4639 RepID=A0A426XDZ3_ENSVE|nr:hypothetical protein B296_00041445 [Ensete ventricosum]